MNRHVHLDRILEDWLSDGPSQLPDRTIDAIVRQLDQTKQRRPGWLPWRPEMKRNFLALGGIAAAIVVIVVAGAIFLGLNANQLGVGAPPTPSPSPTAEASPEPEGVRFGSERHGYSILLPDDSWKVQEVPGEWAPGRVPSESPQTPGMDKFEPVGRDDLRFHIISQPVPDGTSFEEWVSDLDESLARDFPNCQLTDEFEAGTVDGSAARIMHLRCAGTFPPYWSSVLWFHGGRGYAMTFNLPPGLAEDPHERRTAIDAWLARIDLTPATAAPPPDEATTEQAIATSI